MTDLRTQIQQALGETICRSHSPEFIAATVERIEAVLSQQPSARLVRAARDARHIIIEHHSYAVHHDDSLMFDGDTCKVCTAHKQQLDEIDSAIRSALTAAEADEGKEDTLRINQLSGLRLGIWWNSRSQQWTVQNCEQVVGCISSNHTWRQAADSAIDAAMRKDQQ